MRSNNFTWLALAAFAVAGFIGLGYKKGKKGESNMKKSYFTIEELSKSATAKANGLDNTPPASVVEKLQALIDNVLDPARAAYGAPIFVHSGYRSPQVNKLVGGVSNSQHIAGEAADIDTNNLANNRKLFAIIVEQGNFDQIIWEGGGSWIHVSYRGAANRGTIYAQVSGGYKNIKNDWRTYIGLK